MTPGQSAAVPGNQEEALGIVEAGEAIGIPTTSLLLNGVARTLAQPQNVIREAPQRHRRLSRPRRPAGKAPTGPR